MKITLVRHGETEENFLNKLYTITNCPMNDTGRRQVERLKYKLKDEKYDYCFTNPSIRCFETSLILVGDRVEIISDSRLSERVVGELEGRPYDEYNQYKFWDWDRNCSDYGVEPIKDLFSRCMDFVSYIEREYKKENLLIVVDREVYRTLRHLFLNDILEYNLLDGNIENCKYEVFNYKKKNH